MDKKWCGVFNSLFYISFLNDNKMFAKGLLLVLLVSAVFAYEKEGNVLVLHDSDFPKVIEEHDFIMIEFYAPWYFYPHS